MSTLTRQKRTYTEDFKQDAVSLVTKQGYSSIEAARTGVKVATEKIPNALGSHEYTHFIRLDIKSFYASISRFKLVGDINKHFNDKKVQGMLARIINNPLEVPNSIRNPDRGIALRGPLSQLFSVTSSH